MSADLVPFTYEGATVRSVVLDGEPWFVARDICNVLGLPNLSMAMARLSDDEKGVNRIDTLGGPQQMAVVSESGMYALVLRSDKPGAAAFRRWITTEVLPAIRKTGSYSTAPALTEDELIHRALEVSARRVAELTERNVELEQKVEADAPKVEAYEQFMEADGTYLVGTVARMLGTSQNKLFAELRDRGVFIAKGSMKNTPYQRFMQHFTVKATHFERNDGSEGVSYTTRVKPSGVDFIRRRLNMQVVAS